MICAVHQPNFAPWLPYFRKVQQADVFVFLTEALFSRTYFQHRFNIGEKWYTMPVVYGNVPIKDKKYHDPLSGWAQLKRKLPEYKKLMSKFDDCICESLCDTNIDIIFTICKMLNIDTKKLRYDYPTELTQSERLIEICRHYDCDTYLSGNGAKQYIDEQAFEKAGIKLIYQKVEEEDKQNILGVLCRIQ